MRPTLSVIIIVKNDRGIADTLAGLAGQMKPAPTEVIVVDASDPSILADIRAAHPEVRWYQFKPAIPNKTSIPEQRNFGIAHAAGDIIVFIDANCIPSEGWLAKLTAPILSDAETMAAGSVSAINPKTRANLNTADTKGKYLTSSPTINLAFKKSLWTEVGGFDESFLFGSDVDFTWRCSDAGNKILFVREAGVTHDWGDTKAEYKRSFNYGKARGKLMIKHRHRIKELFSDNLYVTFYTAYFLGLPLTLLAFWYPIFAWYPLFILIAFAKNMTNKPFKTVFLNIAYTLGFYKVLLWKLGSLVAPQFVFDLVGKLYFIRGTATYRKNRFMTLMKFARWMIHSWINKEISFTTPDGTKFVSMPHNYSSFLVCFDDFRDPSMQAFQQKHLNKDSVFVDAGGNIGTYTVRAAQLVGSGGKGKVISIEAHPFIYSYLMRNIALNGFKEAIPVNVALGDEPGELEMSYDPSNAGETHVAVKGEEKVVVPVRKLDDVLADLKVTNVDYLKIDVEGFEYPLLVGAKGIIARSPKIVVQTELSDRMSRRYGRPIADVIGLLESLGLSAHTIDKKGASMLADLSDMSEEFDVLWWRDESAKKAK